MKFIVSEDLTQEAYHQLIEFSRDIIFIRKCDLVYKGLRSHADLQCFLLPEKRIVVHPKIHPKTVAEMRALGIEVLYGESKLQERYPGDIPYNAALVGNKVFHHLNYMDPIVKKHLQLKNIELVHVRQAYTKCSILPIGNDSIITADCGIAKKAQQLDMDVLLIESGHIRLPGFNTGFIGGASGIIEEKSVILFNGDITLHPDYNKIYSFIKEKGYYYICLQRGPLLDIGSIYCLD